MFWLIGGILRSVCVAHRDYSDICLVRFERRYIPETVGYFYTSDLGYYSSSILSADTAYIWENKTLIFIYFPFACVCPCFLDWILPTKNESTVSGIVQISLIKSSRPCQWKHKKHSRESMLNLVCRLLFLTHLSRSNPPPHLSVFPYFWPAGLEILFAS